MAADRAHLDWPFFAPRHAAMARELDAWAAAQRRRRARQRRRRRMPRPRQGARRRRLARPRRRRARVRRPRRRDRHARDLPRPRDAGAPQRPRRLRVRDAGPRLGRDQPRRHATSRRQRYLPRVARGEAIAAFALSEPDAGSDVAAMACAARADGDDYVLDGEKTWISNGGIADFYVVFARTGDAGDPAAKGARGISAFIVDADAPGFAIAERIDVIAPHPLARLRFTGCRVPAGATHRRRGRGLQDRDADARRLPHLGRRRRARLRAPRLRRGDGARDLAQDVRRRPRRLPADAGQARADGD